MKITLDINIDDEQLEALRNGWKANPDSFSHDVSFFLKKETSSNKSIFEVVSDVVSDKLKERFEDDEAALNPSLEDIKREIVLTLYLYGPNDGHNHSCLFSVLERLDPGLARKVRSDGADTVYKERFDDES